MEKVKIAEKYDESWFSQRAKENLVPKGGGEWDYSDSLLLYLPGFDETYEEVQNEENPYHELVTAPEETYLKDIAADVVDELPEHFNFVDLGPGTEHKERFIFDAASTVGKRLTYRPVDISARYLKLAGEYATQKGLDVEEVHAPFEDVASALDESVSDRFVSLGLTYCNYDPQQILALLKEIANGGRIFINSQLRDRIDLDLLRQIYTDVAIPMSRPKLELLGLNPSNDVARIEVTDGVQVWATIKNINELLEEKGLKPGDRMLLFQSLRPTFEELEQDVSRQFERYRMFDTGQSFVGVLAN